MLLPISLVLAVILLVPMFSHKLHVPAIVGFLLVGMAIGPNGLDWLPDTQTVAVLGKIGMLYLMFQSGSEIDFNQVRGNRWKVLLYGFYAFFFPLVIGLVVCRWLLGMSWLTSALMGAMYGSHTLMTYPIVSRYGIQKTSTVSIVVGGTMVSVTLALLLLAVVEAHLTCTDWHRLIWQLPLLIVVIEVLFPRVAQSFLKRFTDPVADFMFVMLLLTLSAWLTEAANMDGILGAFLCGLALNRLLPNRSTLMRRITFVGNSIFVPLFLLGVGMMIDVRVFWSGATTWILALTMILVKLSGKWLAAFVAEHQWRMSATERRLMFGLTAASAAGTLAVVTIGYNAQVFSAQVLNAAVLMILVLCSVSSFVTEHAAKRLALQEDAQMSADKEEERWQVLSLSTAEQHLQTLAEAAQLQRVQMARVESWQAVNRIVEQETCSVAVYEEKQPLNTVSRLMVAVPRYAEKERDFITCFGLVRRLSNEIGADVIFFANSETEKVLRRMCRRKGKNLPAQFREMDDWEDLLVIAKQIRRNDMLVLLSSRPSTASYNPLFTNIPDTIQRFFSRFSTLVVYPEQQTGGIDTDTFLTDIPQASATWSLVSRIKNAVLQMLRKRQQQT